MRYRLMASYLGASYQAAVGPSDRDVTLFAAPPPPEEHGFSPVPAASGASRCGLTISTGCGSHGPSGPTTASPAWSLTISATGCTSSTWAWTSAGPAQLGYWEVDRGVFEVVVPRHDVTDLAEERHEFPIALLLSALPRALGAGDAGGGRRRCGAGRPPGPSARAGRPRAGRTARSRGAARSPRARAAGRAAGAGRNGAGPRPGPRPAPPRRCAAARRGQPPADPPLRARPQRGSGLQLGMPPRRRPRMPRAAARRQRRPMQQPVGRCAARR